MLEASRAAVGRYAWGFESMLVEARTRGLRLGIPHLAFHQIHTTNNRLGVTLIEEALLASALARDGQEAAR